jgi:hypothetical protein
VRLKYTLSFCLIKAKRMNCNSNWVLKVCNSVDVLKLVIQKLYISDSTITSLAIHSIECLWNSSGLSGNGKGFSITKVNVRITNSYLVTQLSERRFCATFLSLSLWFTSYQMNFFLNYYLFLWMIIISLIIFWFIRF